MIAHNFFRVKNSTTTILTNPSPNLAQPNLKNHHPTSPMPTTSPHSLLSSIVDHHYSIPAYPITVVSISTPLYQKQHLPSSLWHKNQPPHLSTTIITFTPTGLVLTVIKTRSVLSLDELCAKKESRRQFLHNHSTTKPSISPSTSRLLGQSLSGWHQSPSCRFWHLGLNWHPSRDGENCEHKCAPIHVAPCQPSHWIHHSLLTITTAEWTHCIMISERYW